MPPLSGQHCYFDQWGILGDGFQKIECDITLPFYYSLVPPKRKPTDGQWGKWAPWGRCSRSCDSGRRVRHRKCDSPAPYRGRYCVGSPDEEEVTFILFLPHNARPD